MRGWPGARGGLQLARGRPAAATGLEEEKLVAGSEIDRNIWHRPSLPLQPGSRQQGGENIMAVYVIHHYIFSKLMKLFV